MRLSTEDLPARNRREIIHEMYARTVFRADLETQKGAPFQFDVKLYGLPDLGVAAARRFPIAGRSTVPSMAAARTSSSTSRSRAAAQSASAARR
jgi:hypothetical protein